MAKGEREEHDATENFMVILGIEMRSMTETVNQSTEGGIRGQRYVHVRWRPYGLVPGALRETRRGREMKVVKNEDLLVCTEADVREDVTDEGFDSEGENYESHGVLSDR